MPRPERRAVHVAVVVRTRAEITRRRHDAVQFLRRLLMTVARTLMNPETIRLAPFEASATKYSQIVYVISVLRRQERGSAEYRFQLIDLLESLHLVVGKDKIHQLHRLRQTSRFGISRRNHP